MIHSDSRGPELMLFEVSFVGSCSCFRSLSVRRE